MAAAAEHRAWTNIISLCGTLLLLEEFSRIRYVPWEEEKSCSWLDSSEASEHVAGAPGSHQHLDHALSRKKGYRQSCTDLAYVL